MRFLLPLALLAACGEDPTQDADWLSDDGAADFPVDQAPPPAMTMAGTCPGPVTFTLNGFTPGGGWVVARSPVLAPGMPIPGGPCAGTWLRIGPPASLAATGTASALGAATFSVTLPPAACGTYLQPLDVATCTTGMFLQL